LDAAGLEANFRAVFRQRPLVRYSVAEWRDVVRRTFEPFTKRCGEDSLFRGLWDEFHQPHAWQVFDEVVPVLRELRQRGIRLAVTSNWDDRLEATLGSLGLRDFFEVVVASCEVGVPKPDPAVFAETARRLGLRTNEILHVGDSDREDCEGAQVAGCEAVLLDRSGANLPGTERDLRFLLDRFAALP
jgi:putative hydrolase of the HAD superfamily